MNLKPERTVFFVLVSSANEERNANILIHSLREYGGQFSEYPVWIFLPETYTASHRFIGLGDVDLIPLDIDERFHDYYFADKVSACARAEEMVDGGVRSLVWLSPQSLIVNPPVLFELSPEFDAALRPVHIKNIGINTEEPLDGYWREIYQVVGVQENSDSVETFVEMQTIRPYFNSHIFSIDPSKKVLRTWLELFKEMVFNKTFQSEYCGDILHQVFLHQAILSALILKMLVWERIRFLSPEYSYPLHFHDQVPPSCRANTLNELACPVYEETFQYPDPFGGIEVHEPLKSWLEVQTQTTP